MREPPAPERIRLGISSCLLGARVRYDGGDALEPYLRDTLGRYVEWVPLCPESECGLPTPREPLRLVGDPALPRLVARETDRELTAQLQRWAAQRLEQLAEAELAGFVFKSRSPSCGVHDVKLYDAQGSFRRGGRGLFAAAVMRRWPLLPVADELQLRDPELRDGFFERIFVWRRFQQLLRSGARLGQLVAFHARHKLLVLAHSTRHYRELGALVAQGKALGRRALLARYAELLAQALALPATPAKQTNVLQHALGYFKKQLDAAEKQELLALIAAFRAGQLPLLAPLWLLRHLARKHEQRYLREQVYLDPHPLELLLRYHA